MERFSIFSSEGLYPRVARSQASLKKLAVAMILQALDDILFPGKIYGKTENQKRYWYEDALHWVFSKGRNAGSLEWYCEILDVDSSNIRGWVKRFLESGPEEKIKIMRDFRFLKSSRRTRQAARQARKIELRKSA